MVKETILENESISVWYYPEKKIVHHQVHKYAFGEALRNALDKGVEVLKENGANKWLSDDQSHAAMAKEDVEWGKAVWTPKALEAGFRHWAIVLPKSPVGKMSHRRMIADYSEMGINVEIFEDVESAIAWLDAQ